MIKNKRYPKDRSFLGCVCDSKGNPHYWDIFFWATKEDGVDKACFVDSGLFAMPKCIGWHELPSLEES